MLAVFNARAVARHEVEVAVVPAKDRVRVMIAAGVEFVPDPALVNQWPARTIPFKHLDPVAAHRVKLVVIDQQPLRPAPAQAGRDNLAGIENTVAVLVDEPPDRIAIADEQSSLAVER